MIYEDFAEGLFELTARCTLFDTGPLETVVIINPRAGGFTHKTRLQQAFRDLAACRNEAMALPPAAHSQFSTRLLLTMEAKHAGRMADELAEIAALHQDTQYLVIIASGDGTSLEFLDQLSRVDDEFRRRVCVLRLPMGTGNDGSDGRQLRDSLSRLCGKGSIAEQSALRVFPASGGPASKRARDGFWSAFNIASIGLDAYVTHKTNELKSKLPGNSYKMWVDVASIFYDRVYPVLDMTITADRKQQNAWQGQFLLCAMGVSGRRTYGANKPILPDSDNVCAIRQMPLLRKLQLKDPITRGEHRKFPEALFCSASRLEIAYSGKLLVQMDGEAELLLPADFPLIMEKTGPLIRHLARKADSE